MGQMTKSSLRRGLSPLGLGLGLVSVAWGVCLESCGPVYEGLGPSAPLAPGQRVDAGAESPCFEVARDAGLRVVFRTGFEEPVAFENSIRETLTGGDEGYDWASFSHQINYGGSYSLGHVRSELSAVFHGGARGLHQEQLMTGAGQNVLTFFHDDSQLGTDVYVSRWLRLPDDFDTRLTEAYANTVLSGNREYRSSSPPGTPGSQFVLHLNIQRPDVGKPLKWMMSAIDYSAGPFYSDWIRPPKGWTFSDSRLPISMGRWFRLETFFRRHATSGRVLVCVDGETLFDLQDVRTKNDTTYASTTISAVTAGAARFPFWIDVDDVEVRGR